MGGWSQERREVGGVAIRGNAIVRAGFHLYRLLILEIVQPRQRV